MSDFGREDGSATVMEGVIKAFYPKTDVMHLTHDIPVFNIAAAGLILATHVPYFAVGTVFVCVVDPGVGTEREPIAIKTAESVFVGPNNGVFGMVLEKELIKEVVVLDKSEYHFPKKTSQTFHGRDIFAPVAAHIANGVPLDEIGTPVAEETLVPSAFPLSAHWEGNISHIDGKVLYIDRFGNLITSITQDVFGEYARGKMEISIAGKVWAKRVTRTFGEGKRDEVLALFGGDFGDLMTMAVDQGSAAERTKAKIGDTVSIRAGEHI